MDRIWFSTPLETVATWWRIYRADGVTLGFTTHDADLWFDGITHRATPGMVPSAIRRSADFQADSAEVQGAISHEAIATADLAAGRFDGAEVAIGLVDWQTLERQALYRGAIGAVTADAAHFTAELRSRKIELQHDPIPRTSPCCRADFCTPGCGLSAARFEHEARVLSCDLAGNAVMVDCGASPAQLAGGLLRWTDGPAAGLTSAIAAASGARIVLDRPIDVAIPAGTRARVREGCDHTLPTCSARFANAANFQGEPFLPGNDLIMSYGLAR
ncbi:MAG: DUF2163 domain-containing protein [Proteobacteria bacterium]|nr:DUF2163 domain-containing protein [Pseudomonadota bacterium]